MRKARLWLQYENILQLMEDFIHFISPAQVLVEAKKILERKLVRSYYIILQKRVIEMAWNKAWFSKIRVLSTVKKLLWACLMQLRFVFFVEIMTIAPSCTLITPSKWWQLRKVAHWFLSLLIKRARNSFSFFTFLCIPGQENWRTPCQSTEGQSWWFVQTWTVCNRYEIVGNVEQEHQVGEGRTFSLIRKDIFVFPPVWQVVAPERSQISWW